MAFGFYPTAWDMGELECLSARDLLVLLALVEHADDDGVCWPGQERLAQMTRVNSRTVRRALKRLEQIGLIQRTRRWAEDGGGRTSDLIRLRFPKAVRRSGGTLIGHPRQVQADRLSEEPHKEPIAIKGARRREARELSAFGAVPGKTRDPEAELLEAFQDLVDCGEAEWIE
jgi:predicted ArsR family transcriptional regulator